MNELARVKDQADADGTEDEERTLSDLMVQQVEFANVVRLQPGGSLLVLLREMRTSGFETLNLSQSLNQSS